MGVVVVIIIPFPILISAATTQLFLTGRIDNTSRLFIVSAGGSMQKLVCFDVVNEALLKAFCTGRLGRHNETFLLDGSGDQRGEHIGGFDFKTVIVITTGGCFSSYLC